MCFYSSSVTSVDLETSSDKRRTTMFSLPASRPIGMPLRDISGYFQGSPLVMWNKSSGGLKRKSHHLPTRPVAALWSLLNTHGIPTPPTHKPVCLTTQLSQSLQILTTPLLCLACMGNRYTPTNKRSNYQNVFPEETSWSSLQEIFCFFFLKDTKTEETSENLF